MKMRILAAAAAAALSVSAALVTVGSAAADPPPPGPRTPPPPPVRKGSPVPPPLSSHVKLYGVVSCARRAAPPLPWTTYLASQVRFQAIGETRDATLFWLSYSVDLNNVPASGENVNVFVTCRDFRNPSWNKTIHVDRQRDGRQNVNLLVH